jgi:hypothetical protein
VRILVNTFPELGWVNHFLHRIPLERIQLTGSVEAEPQSPCGKGYARAASIVAVLREDAQRRAKGSTASIGESSQARSALKVSGFVNLPGLGGSCDGLAALFGC